MYDEYWTIYIKFNYLIKENKEFTFVNYSMYVLETKYTQMTSHVIKFG